MAFCLPTSVNSSNVSMSLAQMRLLSTSISSRRFFSCLMTRVELISSFFTLSQSPSATHFSMLLLWFFSKPKWWGIPTSLNFWMESSARFNGIGESLDVIVTMHSCTGTVAPWTITLLSPPLFNIELHQMKSFTVMYYTIIVFLLSYMIVFFSLLRNAINTLRFFCLTYRNQLDLIVYRFRQIASISSMITLTILFTDQPEF